MSDILVVRLNSHSTQADWLVVDGSGMPLGAVQSGALTEATVAAIGRRVLVLAPGTEVVVAEPELPLKSNAKLAQIVPFALEEQLAAEVEDLHFAVGKREQRPGTPVVVVAHARMQTWLTALAEAGITANALYAETSLVPITANGVTIVIDSSRVYVRREGKPAVVLEVEPLIEALQLALASGQEEREHVTIYLVESDYERERELLEGLREFTASLQLRLMPDGPLPLLAATALQSPPVNLLQGRYAPKSQLNVSFAPWRAAAALAGIFLVVQIGTKVLQYSRLEAAEKRLDTAITQLYQQAMPGAPLPNTLAARKQIEARLAALRGGGQTSGLLQGLSSLAIAVSQTPNTTVEGLSFRNDVLDLRVTAPTVDALDRIQQLVAQQGLSAQIQAANPRESRVEGRLQLRIAGASSNG